MNATKILDAKGLSCPMPIVRTKKEMDTLNTGDILQVVVTDRGALADIPAWANVAGHTIIEVKEHADESTFFIQKS